MTEQELKAVRGLVYHAQAIASEMLLHPDYTALKIAGEFSNPDDPAALFWQAIDRVGRLVYPAWDYRHSDERTE